MQNDPLSHGLWETTAPPAPPTSPLKGEVRADVAVVGCGYTGLSAALRLAEAGAKVVALETVEIGFGGAGRNVGLVNAGLWLQPRDIMKRLGPDYGEQILSLLGEAPAEVFKLIDAHAIDCEPVRNGTLHCAVGRSGAAEIKERAEQWGERGAPVRALTAAETAARSAPTFTRVRSSTCAPEPSSRSPMRAGLAAPRSPRAPRSTPKVRCDRRSGRARSGGSRPTMEPSRPTGLRSRPTSMAAPRGSRCGASEFVCPILVSPPDP